MSPLKFQQSCDARLVCGGCVKAPVDRHRRWHTEEPGDFRCCCPKIDVGSARLIGPGAIAPPLSIRGESRCSPGRIPCPAHARSIRRSPLDHPASCIQNPALACNETAADRRSLLRLPVVFRHPESLEFPRRTDQRHFRFYENAAVNGETFAT